MVRQFLINRPKAYEILFQPLKKFIMHTYVNLFTYNNFRDFTDDLKAVLKGHELQVQNAELRTVRENRRGKQLIFTGVFPSKFLF